MIATSASAPEDSHRLPRNTASELDRRLSEADPHAVIRAALEAVGRDRLALVSSFGSESAALLKVAADVDPAIPVVFLDTGMLFAETLAYRDTLVQKLGLRDVRTFTPDSDSLARQDAQNELWFSDPDACCRLRKVEPLARALAGFDGWLNGRKRYHGAERQALAVVEADEARLKFNPLANASIADVQRILAEADLPPHPLVASGFASVGCMPCTSRTQPGEDVRAGRWRGRDKRECGIHVTSAS